MGEVRFFCRGLSRGKCLSGVCGADCLGEVPIILLHLSQNTLPPLPKPHRTSPGSRSPVWPGKLCGHKNAPKAFPCGLSNHLRAQKTPPKRSRTAFQTISGHKNAPEAFPHGLPDHLRAQKRPRNVPARAPDPQRGGGLDRPDQQPYPVCCEGADPGNENGI